MKTRPTMTVCLALFCGATLGLGACGTASRDAQIRADVTPELETLYERQVDMDNNWALMMDENGRMFKEDIGRALYLDRPSHLTREPVPRP